MTYQIDTTNESLIETLVTNKLITTCGDYMYIKKNDLGKCVVFLDDKNANSILVVAADERNLDHVKLLLESNVDPNKSIHNAPLLSAVRNGDIKMVELLLAHNADPFRRYPTNGNRDVFMQIHEFNVSKGPVAKHIFKMLLSTQRS